MAKYRQVHITFWQDPFIEELEPLEKYFYIYLMTNSKTTQCGCYEISMKLIKYETGLKQSQIDTFIELFSKLKKIHYSKESSEFLVINWLKHNSFKSPKVLSCIKKEIKNIKKTTYKDFINSVIDGNTPIDSLSIVYEESMYTQLQQEEEQEEEKEEEQEQKNICVFDYWNSKSLHTHKEVTKSIKQQLDSLAIKSQEDLKTAIDNYEKAYLDENYYYSHAWTLDKFIKQSNGYKEWLNDGSLWVAYKEKNKSGGNNGNHKSNNQKGGAADYSGVESL